ncbi:MAG: RecX family transcriptional regulator [Alphaproteobacteria bacterium]|nr:RecX family transcriptional regulator [Alphaproteobacteria bacterium]
MQKPLTPKRLENIALYYLDRFDASSTKLRQVLLRRLQKQKMSDTPVDPNALKWIENVIQKCVDLGYIDDKRYVENAVRRLSAGGKSARFIQQKLLSEGLDADLIQSFLQIDDDLTRAQTFVTKKHLGKDYEKDLAKLARAGFSYDVARRALKGENNV